MPRPAPARRMPPPRKKIIWLRAIPVMALMGVLLIFGTAYLQPRFPDNPLLANGGLGLSLIVGIMGAFLISRFATITPPPPPSKTQQRKIAAAAARSKDEPIDDEVSENGAEPAATGTRLQSGQRRRRRRR